MQASNKVLSCPCWIIIGRRSFCTIWPAPSCCRTSRVSSSWRKYLIKSFTLSATQAEKSQEGDRCKWFFCHQHILRHLKNTHLNNQLPCGRCLPPDSQERCTLPKAHNSFWIGPNTISQSKCGYSVKSSIQQDTVRPTDQDQQSILKSVSTNFRFWGKIVEAISNFFMCSLICLG